MYTIASAILDDERLGIMQEYLLPCPERYVWLLVYTIASSIQDDERLGIMEEYLLSSPERYVWLLA